MSDDSPVAIIYDTNGNAATIKSASTAAILTDTALVVAISPNNVVAISTSTLPLPTGATTEATLSKRFSGGKNTAATVINTIGDNIIYTPAAGKTLTLFWVFLGSSQNNISEVLAIVKLGTKVVYECYLGNPGAFAHWEPVTANTTNDALIVNLSAGNQSVTVNYTVTEI